MNVLFIHQNFPGQYIQLAASLAAQGHVVHALTDVRNRQPRLVPTTYYEFTDVPATSEGNAKGIDAPFSQNVRRGHAAAYAMLAIKQQGFAPDLILGHPGWGETIFCRDVFPKARLILQAEFYYGGAESDIFFDPEFQSHSKDRPFRTRARNAAMLLSMIDADVLVAPTQWQASQFPHDLRAKLHVVHEGIDTDTVAPTPHESLSLARQNLTIETGDEIITFVNRNLEPYRGFHIFMRALPRILAARPRARAIIVGGDSVSYGPAAPNGKSWKSIFLAEVRGALPMDRVHFVGRIPRAAFVNLMQISAAHVYLTYPFVLSWSMLEAMSAGAPVIGSRTSPVLEVLDGTNGILFDFHDTEALATAVIDVVARPTAYREMRAAARETIIERYDFRRRCLPGWLALINGDHIHAS